MKTTTKKTKTTPQPVSSSNLSERAMLVQFSTSLWRAVRTDEAVTDEVAKSHNSDRDMGKYKKRLVDRKVLDCVRQPIREAWEIHKTMTLPWQDGGTRVLSSDAYLTYTEKMRKKIALADKALATEFLPNYAKFKREAKQKLNGLYREEDYPNENQIASKFGFRLVITPLPSTADFRVKLPEAEKQRVMADMNAWLKEQMDISMRNIWERMSTVVEKMAKSLKAYTRDSDGNVENTFRDTLVTNITDVLDLIPILNITDDHNIKAFSQRIKSELTMHDPEKLRDDEKIRNDVAKRAEEIASKMAGFLS
jgi:hypothetical protein